MSAIMPGISGISELGVQYNAVCNRLLPAEDPNNLARIP